MKNLPTREKFKSVRTPKEFQSSLDQKESESKHTIHREADRLHCTVCTENFRIGDPSLVPWLSTACSSTQSTCRPTPIMNTMLHIGNQVIHHTHALSVHRGLVFCNKCGSRKGTKVVKNLARPCGPPSSFGKATLKAIHKDMLPSKLVQWPTVV